MYKSSPLPSVQVKNDPAEWAGLTKMSPCDIRSWTIPDSGKRQDICACRRFFALLAVVGFRKPASCYGERADDHTRAR